MRILLHSKLSCISFPASPAIVFSLSKRTQAGLNLQPSHHHLQPSCEVTDLTICSQELQAKLSTPEKQEGMLKALETTHKIKLQRVDEGCAVVELLQAQVIDAACNDPAALILPYLVAPLIRDRFQAEAKALELMVWLLLLAIDMREHNCSVLVPASL